MRTTCAVGMVLAALTGTAYADDACKKYEVFSGQNERVDDDAVFRLAECRKMPNLTVQNIFRIDNPTWKISQIARVAHLIGCFSANDGQLPDRVLMCRADEKQLDKAAFDAEVAATTLDDAHKATLTGKWELLQTKIAKANAAVASRASDPMYKQVLDTLDAGFSDWDAFYAKNREVIDAAYAVEAKWLATSQMIRGHQPVDLGCAPVRAGWERWVAEKKFTSAKEVSPAVEADEVATIALRAVALCDMAARVEPAAKVEFELLRKKFAFRGPRMHAVFAAMSTLGKVIPENIAPAMKPVLIQDEVYKIIGDVVDTSYEGVSNEIEQGKVAKVEVGADGALVSFKKESWIEPDMQCYDLPSRYWSQSEGRYKHDFACKKVGQHTETSQLDPALFSTAFVKGLKAGQIVSLRSAKDRAGKRLGFAVEARSGTKVADKGKAKVIKRGADVLQTGGTLDVVYGVATR